MNHPIRNSIAAIAVALALGTIPGHCAEFVIRGGSEQPDGVPNYRQQDFRNDNDCGPTAAAMLLGYYDRNGWPGLVRGGAPYYAANAPTSGIRNLVRILQALLPYSETFGTWPTGFIGESVIEAAARFDPGARNWSSNDDNLVSQDTIKSETRANRPMMLLFLPIWGVWEANATWNSPDGADGDIDIPHWTTVIGYREEAVDWWFDEFYVVMRSGWADGGGSTLWYHWSAADEIYSVSIVPSGVPSGFRRDNLCVGRSTGASFQGASWGETVAATDSRYLAGDFNGDGREDVAQIDAAYDWYEDHPLLVWRSNGADFDPLRQAYIMNNRASKWIVGDFDRDGRDDFAQFQAASDGSILPHGAFVYRNLADRTVVSRWDVLDTSQSMKLFPGDFNGDGRTDYVKFDVDPAGAAQRRRIEVGLSDGTRFVRALWAEDLTRTTLQVQIGDFNGDGRSDFAMFDPTLYVGVMVGISTGNRFDISIWRQWQTNHAMKMVVGDFDADGRDDITMFELDPASALVLTDLRVGLTRTNPWRFDPTIWSRWWNTPLVQVHSGDFDADGRADVMKFHVHESGARRVHGLWVGRSTGNGFSTADWARWNTYGGMKTLTGDFDGDGRTDVLKLDTGL